jgi:hypothetical protein
MDRSDPLLMAILASITTYALLALLVVRAQSPFCIAKALAGSGALLIRAILFGGSGASIAALVRLVVVVSAASSSSASGVLLLRFRPRLGLPLDIVLQHSTTWMIRMSRSPDINYSDSTLTNTGKQKLETFYIYTA